MERENSGERKRREKDAEKALQRMEKRRQKLLCETAQERENRLAKRRAAYKKHSEQKKGKNDDCERQKQARERRLEYFRRMSQEKERQKHKTSGLQD